ncbi:ABC transporter substrate-binding protein [Actinomadura sp. NBRC 104412]|uniref:ABC transporter substrate-binding protein n=1 Tax=Actinomadura sp. NBRC 104412 TaxID=3032203 RepID=UPI0025535E68|nr:ABC transporter substrate-binding protein [Actinomadura sp. NBRC 104412]
MAGLLAVALAATACSQQGASTEGSPSAGPPQRGGQITVLKDASFDGSWPSGLDPATNTTGGANIAQMAAIYGGLFVISANPDGTGAKVVPHQAESYQVLDQGRTLKIKIRQGIKFTDGTPFDAEAVRFNIDRNMKSTCTCRPIWQLAKNGISTEGSDTVVLRFTQPTASAINNIPISNVNWIVSPAALKRMGEAKFRVTPVGAGPFKVVSNRLSSELVLERNPDYFKKGLPYLDRLTFKSIGGDQAAYQALLAGQADAFEGMTTTPLLDQATKNDRLTVTVQPPTSPYVIQLNTQIAPFNNEKARQAIYYATDFQAIARGVFKGRFPVSQTFTAPGGLFHHKEGVPGYRTYNLNEAKRLVQEVGGITVTLGTLGDYVARQVNIALQTQWRQAGINVKIEDYQLNRLVEAFNSGKWQAMLQTAGAWDPAAGVGVAFRFASTSPFTGVKDPKLDQMLNQAAAEVDPAKRDKLYADAGKYISDKAYAPFGLAFAPANLAVKGVYGPGLTTKIPPLVVNSGILWDEVWRAK